MEVLIEFNSVMKVFGEKPVLENFSFTLQKGEVVAILGPSGCGKTTILNIAAGLIKQTEGTVLVHTKDFGYVFQEPRLIPWKTVLDNIMFALGKINKADRKEMDNKALKVLDKVGLKHASHYYPKQLSGGMKQRVSIARALVSDPKIILMDEPFSALDVALKRELQDDVIRLIEEQEIGVIYVTHDPEEAARLADRVLLLSNRDKFVSTELNIPTARANRDEEAIKYFKEKLHSYVS